MSKRKAPDQAIHQVHPTIEGSPHRARSSMHRGGDESIVLLSGQPTTYSSSIPYHPPVDSGMDLSTQDVQKEHSLKPFKVPDAVPSHIGDPPPVTGDPPQAIPPQYMSHTVPLLPHSSSQQSQHPPPSLLPSQPPRVHDIPQTPHPAYPQPPHQSLQYYLTEKIASIVMAHPANTDSPCKKISDACTHLIRHSELHLLYNFSPNNQCLKQFFVNLIDDLFESNNLTLPFPKDQCVVLIHYLLDTFADITPIVALDSSMLLDIAYYCFSVLGVPTDPTYPQLPCIVMVTQSMYLLKSMFMNIISFYPRHAFPSPIDPPQFYRFLEGLIVHLKSHELRIMSSMDLFLADLSAYQQAYVDDLLETQQSFYLSLSLNERNALTTAAIDAAADMDDDQCLIALSQGRIPVKQTRINLHSSKKCHQFYRDRSLLYQSHLRIGLRTPDAESSPTATASTTPTNEATTTTETLDESLAIEELPDGTTATDGQQGDDSIDDDKQDDGYSPDSNEDGHSQRHINNNSNNNPSHNDKTTNPSLPHTDTTIPHTEQSSITDTPAHTSPKHFPTLSQDNPPHDTVTHTPTLTLTTDNTHVLSPPTQVPTHTQSSDHSRHTHSSDGVSVNTTSTTASTPPLSPSINTLQESSHVQAPTPTPPPPPQTPPSQPIRKEPKYLVNPYDNTPYNPTAPVLPITTRGGSTTGPVMPPPAQPLSPSSSPYIPDFTAIDDPTRSMYRNHYQLVTPPPKQHPLEGDKADIIRLPRREDGGIDSDSDSNDDELYRITLIHLIVRRRLQNYHKQALQQSIILSRCYHRFNQYLKIYKSRYKVAHTISLDRIRVQQYLLATQCQQMVLLQTILTNLLSRVPYANLPSPPHTPLSTSHSHSESQPQSESKPDPQSQSQPDPQSHSESKPDPQSEPTLQLPQLQPQPQPQSECEPQLPSPKSHHPPTLFSHTQLACLLAVLTSRFNESLDLYAFLTHLEARLFTFITSSSLVLPLSDDQDPQQQQQQQQQPYPTYHEQHTLAAPNELSQNPAPDITLSESLPNELSFRTQSLFPPPSSSSLPSFPLSQHTSNGLNSSQLPHQQYLAPSPDHSHADALSRLSTFLSTSHAFREVDSMGEMGIPLVELIAWLQARGITAHGNDEPEESNESSDDGEMDQDGDQFSELNEVDELDDDIPVPYPYSDEVG